MFHLYKGVRAGGGIGDEIEAPDGDEYEVYRIIFDITFFFFVIVILLAIIQGRGSTSADDKGLYGSVFNSICNMNMAAKLNCGYCTLDAMQCYFPRYFENFEEV